MRRRDRPGVLLGVLLVLFALVAAGCGGDDEPEAATTEETEVTVPKETDRERTEATTPIVEEPVEPVQPTTTAPAPAPPPEPAPEPEPAPPEGGVPAYDPSKDDSPRNDKPPPSGSPAERFEQYCRENPEACG